MPSLNEIAVLLCAAVITVPLFKRIGLGSVLGYLAAGVLIGPACLRLVSDGERILHLAESGVILLLFVIGLELAPSRLWVLRKQIFGSGTAQVLISGALLSLAGYALGLPPGPAFVAGFGLAMSSTAFVLQMLAEKGELTSQHGRMSFAILLFQDLAVIPLLALVPMIGAAHAAAPAASHVLDFFKAVAIFVSVIAGGRYLLRPVFRIMAGTRVREIFTAAALLVVVGTAMLMQLAGLSMALGAFLAGVLLADSEYRHELHADIEPFEGLLLGLFFIAVGMTANVGVLIEQPLTVILLVSGLLAIKSAVLFVLARWAGLTSTAAVRLATALPQGGEFAFVLFTAALGEGILDRATADLLTIVVTVSMALTPLLYGLGERFAVASKPVGETRPYDRIEESGHAVIIAGFGRVGQVVGRLLRMKRIPFTALESDPEQVDVVRRYGSRVHFGDASRLELLRAAEADKARVFVLAIDDVEASLRTAQVVKTHFPALPIYARARNRHHAHQLMDLGVKVIVRETFHSSLQLAEDVLLAVGLSKSAARESIDTFRRYDEALLVRQHAVYTDPDKLLQTSREAAAELKRLLEADRDPGQAVVQDPDRT